MRLLYILVLILAVPLLLTAQSKQIEGIRLTKKDTLYANSLKKLSLPDYYKSSKAPALAHEHDNSQLPFFRPAFSQMSFWNCGQSASVGYNFTYEINAARGADGSLPENQYSPNFTFNFHNNGDGWGVNYFNTYDAIMKCGNPNLADYGELFNVGYEGWKSGYELYENAMKNRVTDVMSIDVNKPEGLTTLKYWLLDHLNGSAYGGTANFYFGWNWTSSLPAASPYSGFPVVIESHELATHAMTIVGWNDSIRYDVNGDGQYTNHLDITQDGVVDMQDWEIGGLKYINSTFANDGQGYMLYRTLAIPGGQGGIWNNQVHVINVDANYTPLATMRVKLKHNSRNKIKLIAGVSNNMDDNYPEYTIDFPIFNFQGGDHFMQGFDNAEFLKDMELSLDISSLFSYIEKNKPAKFFLQVAEKDEKNLGEGEIQHYSIHFGSGFSTGTISCADVPTNIVDNSITTLQVEYQPDFEKVEIITENLSTPTPDVLKHYQLEASGGYPPYSWDILKHYQCNPAPSNFQEITNTKLEFNSTVEDGVEIEIPFDFPFYGEVYNTVTAYIDGLLMFEDKDFPYPYFVGEDAMIIYNKVIAPFLGDLEFRDEKDGVWYDADENRAIFRWRGSSERSFSYIDVNFSVVLYPNGNIEFHYGTMNFTDFQIWTSGISNGDKMNYLLNGFNQDFKQIQNHSYLFEETGYNPETIYIDDDGNLYLAISNQEIIYPVEIQVTDSKGITNSKTYHVSTSGITIDYLINNAETQYIEYNENTDLTFTVYNNSGSALSDVKINFTTDDEITVLSEESADIGTLEPGQSKTIENATSISLDGFVSDNYGTVINCEVKSSSSSVNTGINLYVKAPELVIQESKIINDDDGYLYPGENAKVKLTVQNIGQHRSQEYSLKLSTDNPHIYIPPETRNISQLNPGDTVSAEFIIAASYNISLGTLVELNATLLNNEYIVDQSVYEIRTGHIPALIIDLTPEQKSGHAMKQILDELGMQNRMINMVSNRLEDYLSIYVCMGGLFNLIALTEKEEDLITNYILNGGNVYLEGMAAWQDISESEMLKLFNIRNDEPSYYYPLDSIIGTDMTYTKDMLFGVDDQNPYINYFIHPEDGAKSYLRLIAHDSSDVCISFDEGSYKTIGSSIQFGALTDTDSIGTRKNLLLSILDFFDIKKYIYTDIEDDYVDNSNIKLYPNPSSGDVYLNIPSGKTEEIDIMVYDLLGNMITRMKSTDSSHLNLFGNLKDKGGSLTPGIYIVKVRIEDKISTHKLILK